MKRARGVCCLLLAAVMFAAEPCVAWAGGGDIREAVEAVSVEALPARHAILIEQSTGQVLFEQQADTPTPPASITKVMTLLLTMRALADGRITVEDTVTCSEHAASMGGSQIWLEPGEEMTVHDLLKAVCVSSANDAAVALAEHLAGSEEAFVVQMNETAAELGMKNTVFRNASGLDEEGHLSTARDIALMSRALLCYPQITEYTTIWTDTLRGGATELTNTNRLVRFYGGTTGLKTGTTDGAGHCISASATRNDMSLIAVVLGSSTGTERFDAARSLLEHGFANYAAVLPPTHGQRFAPAAVEGGVEEQVALHCAEPERIVVRAADRERIESEILREEALQAPVAAGQQVGTVRLTVDGQELCRYPITAASDVARMTVGAALRMLAAAVFLPK